MMTIAEGDTVAVHYTGKLEDGEVFDSSEGREPLEFTVGAGQLIQGFDDAVKGLDEGETATIEVPPEKGYGERNPEMIQELPRERLQNVDNLETGQVLGLETEDGRQFQATVKKVADETVTLDFNHFLAGKTLVFDIEVVKVA